MRLSASHICVGEYFPVAYICLGEYDWGMAKPFNMERFFQALGDRTRLRLLNLMGEQEICVCYFVEVLGEPQPKISRHLAYLRRAGVAVARRDGKWMHYRLVMPPDDSAAGILRQLMNWLKQEKSMRADRAKLAKACCSTERFVALQAAPLPIPVTTTFASKHAQQ
jgi:ArsR family transcriptional regulator, arsenate/arsenite/antimonite-responsive transcriptional repressor